MAELLIFWFVLGLIGAIVAGAKNRTPIRWFFLTLLFPFVLFILVFMPTLKKSDGR